MSNSSRQIIGMLFLLVTAITFGQSLSAAEVSAVRQALSAECGTAADFFASRHCLLACDVAIDANDQDAEVEALKQCKTAHAKAMASNPVIATEAETGTPATETAGRRPRSRSAAPATQPTLSNFDEIEGIFLRGSRSGYLVRVEGNEAWKANCNEAARQKGGSDAFPRTVKRGDRVRLVNVNYDPAEAGNRVTHCLMESFVNLGPSSQQ